ncbi:MAG TPA: type I-U CRISPR-associated RAMP protein Csb1/Cas7u [Stellaceae bacterium]|jgi:CRISPR-associated protein Csb1|nr:type I-U CRISPR-associated RAMP protein Csb1/Cas7u [Stellaceae bacterium]
MTSLTAETINDWADNKDGPVALTCKQKLLPVEGEGGVIFPPTYADIGYNIDMLSDGTKVATIDSVGSQANRMEPIFARVPYSSFVPQITIELHKGDDDGREFVERRSIFDLAHRSADAVVYSCPKLAPTVTKAYAALRRHRDAGPLCSLAPTSLLFGVWDSRGGSGEKRPRLIRSIIRAWDVEPFSAAAQFNSIWKALNEEQQADLKKEAKAKHTRLSEKGLADAPATFRKVSPSAAKQMPEFRDGSPNPERRVLGGVVTRGRIERDVTVNLVALRNIHGATEERTREIRRYMLALALLTATADIELFLREGCNLRFADQDDHWFAVPRRGEPVPIELSLAKELLLGYAKVAVAPFKKEWPTELSYAFDLKEAKKLLAKKEEDEEE